MAISSSYDMYNNKSSKLPRWLNNGISSSLFSMIWFIINKFLMNINTCLVNKQPLLQTNKHNTCKNQFLANSSTFI